MPPRGCRNGRLIINNPAAWLSLPSNECSSVRGVTFCPRMRLMSTFMPMMIDALTVALTPAGSQVIAPPIQVTMLESWPLE